MFNLKNLNSQNFAFIELFNKRKGATDKKITTSLSIIISALLGILISKLFVDYLPENTISFVKNFKTSNIPSILLKISDFSIKTVIIAGFYCGCYFAAKGIINNYNKKEKYTFTTEEERIEKKDLFYSSIVPQVIDIYSLLHNFNNPDEKFTSMVYKIYFAELKEVILNLKNIILVYDDNIKTDLKNLFDLIGKDQIRSTLEIIHEIFILLKINYASKEVFDLSETTILTVENFDKVYEEKSQRDVK